jgi:hypothetical protein
LWKIFFSEIFCFLILKDILSIFIKKSLHFDSGFWSLVWSSKGSPFKRETWKTFCVRCEIIFHVKKFSSFSWFFCFLYFKGNHSSCLRKLSLVYNLGSIMKKMKLKKERHHHICTKCCNNNLNGLVMKELRVKALNSIKKWKTL